MIQAQTIADNNKFTNRRIRTNHNKKQFILLLVLFNILSLNSYNQTISENGTLVIVTPTKQGLVIVADKLSKYSNLIEVDTIVKIRQINNYLGFSVTGTVKFLDPTTLLPFFNSKDIVSNFYSLNTNSNQEIITLQKLSDELVSKFKAYLDTKPFKDWPQSGNSPDNILFQIILYGYNKKDKEMQYSILRFYYKKELTPVIEVKYELYGFRPSSKPIIIGNTHVCEEITDGHDNRFDDIRSNKEIKKFITGEDTIPLISSKEAISFSKYFIKECSILTSLIDSSNNKIGKKVDVAIINEIKGFSWLEKGK